MFDYDPRSDEKQQFAMEAMDLMEKAEAKENNGEWAKAAYLYQEAAEKLAKSQMIPQEKIQEVYDKVTYLNHVAQQAKEGGAGPATQGPQGPSPEAVQDQAFQLLDQAKDAEQAGNYGGAIEFYLQAVQGLIQAGWSDTQIEGIQAEVQRVQQKMAALAQAQQPAAPTPAGGVQDASSEPAFWQGAPAAPVPAEQEMGQNAPAPAAASAATPAPAPTPGGGLGQEEPYKPTFASVEQAVPPPPAPPGTDPQPPATGEARGSTGGSDFWTPPPKPGQAQGSPSPDISTTGQATRAEGTYQPTFAAVDQGVPPPPKPPAESAGPKQALPYWSAGIDTTALVQEQKHTLKEFQEKRAEQERLQEEAFALMDEAEALARDEEFDAAIQKYRDSVQILTNLGWTTETNQITEIIESLHERKTENEAPAPGPTAAPTGVTAPASEATSAAASAATPELAAMQQASARELQQKQQREAAARAEAFKALDVGSELVKQKQFTQAREEYRRAIDLLNSIGWSQQTQLIYESLQHLDEEEARALQEAQATASQGTYTSPYAGVEDVTLQQKLELEYQQRRESVQQFETRKQHEEQTQAEAFQLIDEGYALMDRDQTDEAVETFNKAISRLNAIGWQSQTAQIQRTVTQLLEEKKLQALREQRRRQRALQAAETQRQLQASMQAISSRQEIEIAAREVPAEERQAAEAELRQKRDRAFELLHQAGAARGSQPPDFDRAFELYHQASLLFLELEWDEQAEKLQDVASQVEAEAQKYRAEQERLQAQRAQELAAQKSLQAKLRAYAGEQERAKQLARARLRKFEERKESLASVEGAAMKLINQATALAKRRSYLDAIGKYQEAITRLQAAGWLQQVPYLQQEVAKLRALQAQKDQEEAQAAQARLQQQLAEKVKAERAHQEETRKKSLLGDLKSLISSAAQDQEEKRLKTELAQRESQEDFLEQQRQEAEEKRKLRSLKEELRQRLEREEAEKRRQQEEAEKKKALEKRQEIRDMLKDLKPGADENED